MSSDTAGIGYGVSQEILTENLEHAPYCSTVIMRPPTHPCKPESLWLTTNGYCCPSSLLADLAPYDLALLPELKIKLKGRFKTVSDIHRELQAVLNSIKENDFHVPKENILNEMAAKLS
jgi:hypothetical protein